MSSRFQDFLVVTGLLRPALVLGEWAPFSVEDAVNAAVEVEVEVEVEESEES